MKQYNGFSPFPGLNVNGKLTLGENLGDLSGVEAAYAAYKKYTAQHGEPPVIEGLTGDQRFFIAYAQAWQGKVRDEALRQQVLADPHSPPQVSGQRHRPEHRRLVQGVQRAARRQALPAARAARPHLVGG